MSFIEILLIAIGLAMDAFAVSLGIGTAGRANTARPVLRMSFHLGLFQALMPVLGWITGTRVADLVQTVAPWIAVVLLGFVGIRMIRSGLDPDCESCPSDPTRGGTMVMLCVATSIDAFAVGLSLAILQVNILYPSAVIGVVTWAVCLGALLVGGRLGERFGKRMEVFGGLLLNVIGLRVLLSALL